MQSARSARSLTITQLWLLLSFALPVIGALLVSLPSVDLAYQLRAGGEFLDTGRITTVDTYTFTVSGEAWFNQQWGAQAILALIHRLAGWEGLAVLRATLVGASFALVLWACRRAGAAPRHAALLTLFAFTVSIGALALRPQLLGVLLFAAAIALVTDRRRHPRHLWLLVPLSAVWANVHGSFFLAPAILGAAWLEDLHDRDGGARRTFTIGALATAATLANPFIAGVWGYALGLSTNPLVAESVTEWQPASIRTPLGALFFASVLAVVVLVARRSRVTPWPTLLWLAVLFMLGLYAQRGIAWWAIGAAVIAASLIERPAIESVRAERPRRLNDVLAALLVLAIIALLPWWKAPDPETGRQGLLSAAPSALTSRLRALAVPGDRLLNPQAWGSWFEFAIPDLPVYSDSRFELFSAELWGEYVGLVNLREGWQEVLDTRGVTIVVIDVRRMFELGNRLAREPGWRIAYADGDGSIFVRSDR